MDGQAPHDHQPPQNGGQQQQPNMMMMYGQPPPQGDQGGAPPQQNPTDPSQQQQQQQQQVYASHPGMAFPPPQMQFFAQPYPHQPGMEQVPYGNFSPQYSQPGQGFDPSQQDYMNTNQYLLARLQQTPWMTGYGMPMTTTPEGYAMPADAMMMGPWSATSAGLLGKIGGQEPKKKSGRKKHKDKPKRPLSAYNLFFKDERKNILESVSKTQEEQQEGDDEEEQGDGKKKTKAPQGKIGFENLAKIIGQRWQKLEPDRIEHYKKLAAIDMKRYKAAMEVFLAKIENEKKKKYEVEEGEEQYKEEGEGDDESGKPAVKKETEEEEFETKQV